MGHPVYVARSPWVGLAVGLALTAGLALAVGLLSPWVGLAVGLLSPWVAACDKVKTARPG